MTRNEALTKVLEAIGVSFKEGNSVSINGMLIDNYRKDKNITFDYDENLEVIRTVYIANDMGVIACIMEDRIKEVVESEDNMFLTDTDNNKVFGFINGETFVIKGRR